MEYSEEFERFRFGNRIWLDKIASWRNPRRALVVIVALSLAPLLLGMLVSYLHGRFFLFATTTGFWIGSLGLLITLVIISYGSYSQYQIYDRLFRCFDMTATERVELVLDAVERHSNFWQHFKASAAIVAIGFAMLWASTSPTVYHSLPWLESAASFPRLSAFLENGWYEPENTKTFIWVCVIFILIMAPALGTSASIIIRMPKLLWEISKRRPIMPPSLVKIHFARAAQFYAVVSFSWLIGFGLMFLLFRENSDPVSILLLAIVFVAGAINFIFPQIAYIRSVHKSEDECLGYLSQVFSASNQAGKSGFSINHINDETKDDSELILQMTQHDDWVYPLHQTYVITAFYAISFVGSVGDKANSTFFGIFG